jgi:hypothetical protein
VHDTGLCDAEADRDEGALLPPSERYPFCQCLEPAPIEDFCAAAGYSTGCPTVAVFMQTARPGEDWLYCSAADGTVWEVADLSLFEEPGQNAAVMAPEGHAISSLVIYGKPADYCCAGHVADSFWTGIVPELADDWRQYPFAGT